MRRHHINLASIVVLVLLSDCQTGSPAPSATTGATTDLPAASAVDAVTIGFGAQEYERQVYEPLIAAFNLQNPGIHVQFVALDAFTRPNGDQPGASTHQLRQV